jgi:putative aldouronate transport system substrate-binding protein
VRKSYYVVLLVLTLLTSLLTGCSGNSESESSSSASGGAANPSPTSVPTESSVKVEPVTLDLYYFNQAFRILGDFPVFKKAAEATGVSLNNVAPADGDDKQAWNLLLASGELPDIIAHAINDLNGIGVQKALVPLNDLIEQHAPNIKKFLDSNPQVRSGVTASDGNIYVIPFVSDGLAQEGWFIRQDWLDKLSLQVPTTVDEYYSVLKAFREQDPNGNNKKDEVPFFHRNTGYGFASLYPLWDAFHTFFIKDGKIVFGPNEPEYKTALTELAKWYKEGLIDREIFTRGNTARDDLFGTNTGGSVHDWFASTANFNNTMTANTPDFNLQPMAPPTSISGEVFEVTKRNPLTNNRGWSISANAKDQVAIMKYFDYWWTEEGRRLLNFGIEGETYTMVDGKPQFTESVLKEPSVPDNLGKTVGAQINIGGWQDFAYEEQWTNEIALKGVKMYTDNNYISTDYTLPPLSFTMDEDKRIKELVPSIETYVKETTQKWYMGGESVESSFDKYIEQLKKLQLDQVLEIYNAAYQRFLTQ